MKTLIVATLWCLLFETSSSMGYHAATIALCRQRLPLRLLPMITCSYNCYHSGAIPACHRLPGTQKGRPPAREQTSVIIAGYYRLLASSKAEKWTSRKVGRQAGRQASSQAVCQERDEAGSFPETMPRFEQTYIDMPTRA